MTALDVRLPNEIIRAVLEQLDKPSLRNVALGSRLLYGIARPLLWADITIADDTNASLWLYFLISENRGILEDVRTLRLVHVTKDSLLPLAKLRFPNVTCIVDFTILDAEAESALMPLMRGFLANQGHFSRVNMANPYSDTYELTEPYISNERAELYSHCTDVTIALDHWDPHPCPLAKRLEVQIWRDLFGGSIAVESTIAEAATKLIGGCQDLTDLTVVFMDPASWQCFEAILEALPKLKLRSFTVNDFGKYGITDKHYKSTARILHTVASLRIKTLKINYWPFTNLDKSQQNTLMASSGPSSVTHLEISIKVPSYVPDYPNIFGSLRPFLKGLTSLHTLHLSLSWLPLPALSANPSKRAFDKEGRSTKQPTSLEDIPDVYMWDPETAALIKLIEKQSTALLVRLNENLLLARRSTTDEFQVDSLGWFNYFSRIEANAAKKRSLDKSDTD